MLSGSHKFAVDRIKLCFEVLVLDLSVVNLMVRVSFVGIEFVPDVLHEAEGLFVEVIIGFKSCFHRFESSEEPGEGFLHGVNPEGRVRIAGLNLGRGRSISVSAGVTSSALRFGSLFRLGDMFSTGGA